MTSSVPCQRFRTRCGSLPRAVLFVTLSARETHVFDQLEAQLHGEGAVKRVRTALPRAIWRLIFLVARSPLPIIAGACPPTDIITRCNSGVSHGAAGR